MASAATLVFFLAFTLTVSSVYSGSDYYSFARIESCGGCSLKRHPDVKKFIFDDVPQYNNVEYKHIQGAVPELVLFDKNEEEVERLPLSMLTREECNDLLISKGFTKKAVKDEI